MKLDALKRVYFIGIGGIGMSAIARFFNEKGVKVSGYDRTATILTRQLEAEGIDIHYTDDVNLLDQNADLVVYTPAIPATQTELVYYREHNFEVVKRSDVLQEITRTMYAITVAGTHGKTTVSTMIAHLLRHTGYGCNAFLGGISVNYDKNFWSSDKQVAVIEADEYDRSFLKLSPDIALLTAIDADHLDIYGTVEAIEEAFIQYSQNIKPNGTLLVKQGLHRDDALVADHKLHYSLQNVAADSYATNITMVNGGYTFDVKQQEWSIENIALHIGGLHNVENAVAAITVAHLLGISNDKIRAAVADFKGIKRRFEYMVKKDEVVYIDDYAHHPEELKALIHGATSLFAGKHSTVIFQPHLFSRTRDFADGFAESLALADEIILLPIYPARELPIEGVTSEMIAGKIKNKKVTIMNRDDVSKWVAENPQELIITAGAGDIDLLREPLKEILNKQ
ncbi:UDP-N-acetylmuramate--L-alanine ligase [Chitinophaga skermanii]|uniref:UDP-N-acetylmuramate--L-alanine ligase n=1 Tax=Chitinophaga skermanii TaxID=331697 RepID=A0A327Q209_9BACT|nr:UDP-N-acetylmuramate--L-alanine ligase [Chitinophaga skermanii]RAI98470.1 UDP-N-acetylmuramate--L-alanine ligase [Chitinophaga skermanii]